MKYQVRSGMDRLLDEADTLDEARRKAIKKVNGGFDTTVVYIWNYRTLMGLVREWDGVYTYGDYKSERRINKDGSVSKGGRNYGV